MKILSASLVLAAAAIVSPLRADVKLPAVISDHMVLQAGVPASVFGWAEPGEQITIQFNGQTINTTTAGDGTWRVWLNPLKAGDSGDMTIAGRNRITVSDVLAGEVWVGSGQSNMQWTVKASNNPDEEARNATYPKIRLFRVPLKSAHEPQDNVDAKWEVCAPETVPGFSAVLYFFGRSLHKKLNVPFGLIQTAYGGTPAQAWTTREALARDPALMPILGEWAKVLDNYPTVFAKYQKDIAEWEKIAKSGAGEAPRKPAMPVGPGHAHTPAGLYNAMVHPIVQYTIQGAIWYQGESNASRVQAPLYQRLFETMVQDWRNVWGQGDFPFLWVQLANFEKAGSPADWILVQEAQANATRLKRTGMAVINDIGNPVDIHPKNKQDVGERLALAARHIAYREQLTYASPRYRTATVETATTGDRGVKMRVWFDSTGGTLKTRGGGAPVGFELAGADKRFYAADARIDGDTVVVSSPNVATPLAVRYAWSANPSGANLVNAAGLPAGVFRSREW